MINVLIADDNIHFAINLMNYITNLNNEIRICNIAKNGKETLEILNNQNNIDVILLDYKMPIYNGQEVLDMISNKDKYIDSVIIISGIEQAYNLRTNKMVHSIIFKGLSFNDIVKKINIVFNTKQRNYKYTYYRDKIINEVLYLGYDLSHKGTQYLISIIEYIILNDYNELNNLEKNIYPKIAIMYNESTHNVKCRINRATNSMYCNCQIEKLENYFNFCIDIKPKIKTIITMIINNINKYSS